MPATASPDAAAVASIPTPPTSVPNPGAAKSVDPTPEIGDLDNDFFGAAEKAGLVEKDDLAQKPAAKPAEDKAAEKPKLEEDEEAELRTELDKKPAKKEDAKKQEQADKDAKTAKPKTEGGQMREKLESSIKELEQAKARIKELETNGKPSDEVKHLTERLAAVEKERDEVRSEMMMLKEAETPEFKEKYVQPWNQAIERVAKRVNQLEVVGDEESGQPARAANFEVDFVPIYQQTNYAAAAKLAKQRFGEHADRVMRDWETLHEMNDQAISAKQDLQKNWQQTTAQRTAEQAKQREAFTAALAKTRDALVAKYADRFGEDKDDPEVNRMLEVGKKAWEKQPQTFQEAVQKAASTELAVMAHARLVYNVNKLKKENAALAEKLKEYEESEPGKTKRKGGEQPASEESDEEAELRALRAVR